jgi:very-short-patch-repair endonuclease
MSVVERLAELGGVASRATLIRAASRADVDRALRRSEIVAVARGRYCLPTVDEAPRLAHALGGVLSHTSAALHHGWEVKHTPDRPHVMVPRRRRVDPALAARVTLHYCDLTRDEISDGIVTSPEVTLLHSLRVLPEDEALAIADSALRHGLTPSVLRRVSAGVRGPGAARVRRIAARASGDAANPFESCLRHIALGVAGLNVQPQVTLRGLSMRPDLVDADLGVVLEADSFEWYGDRAALRCDARRYNLMVIDGWLVLRFAWEDVMFDQDYVRAALVSLVRLVHRRAQPCCSHRCAA